jgi:serine/threonine-protein kinase
MAEGGGQIISGKYRLLSVLGEGAMGVVYRAAQLDAEGQVLREVALKMVQPSFSRDPDFTRRFLREVRVTARLHNPHTITVHDTGQSEAGQLYYAMELVEGPTLRGILRRFEPLSVGRAVSIIGQVCEALAEAHGLPEPIVHRDLKPANIFIENRQGHDWVKVGDFGIAKVVGEHSSGLAHTGASPGTPRYMAPEQWKGKAIDGRADLYAVGVMLYELLTGRVPFAGEDGPLSLMYQHLHAAPPPLPESIPLGVRLQVEWLLAKEPHERPANALQVRQALEAALRGEDERSTIILAEQQSAAPVLAEPEKRQRTGELPGVVEQETIVPRTLLQPATMVQPQPKAEAIQAATRGMSWWLYGVGAISVVLLGLVFGGLWDHVRQPPIEKPQPSVTKQEEVVTKSKPPPVETQALQPSPPSDQTREQPREATQSRPQEPPSQQQAKVPPPESAEDLARKAEERRQAVAQQVADLLAQAQKQKAAQRLIAPKGNNALETYREVLRITPDHAEATSGLQEIKDQSRQLGAAAEQRGEWAKAQGHYEGALKIDPQDEALKTALQQVKQMQKESATLAGRYETTASTPVLKEPRPDATVITNLPVATKVTVVGAIGDYLRVQSKKGNPPGYIARQDVTRAQREPEPSKELVQQAVLEKPVGSCHQSVHLW